MRRCKIQELPPADAEVHKYHATDKRSVKFFRYETDHLGRTFYCVKVWQGKASCPTGYVWKKTRFELEKWILEEKARWNQHMAFKALQKKKEAEGAVEMAESLVVGTMLHSSWGYDQTQCDFYQVVKRTARFAWIRPICGEVVEGSEGYDSCRYRPIHNAFVEGGQTTRHRIQSHGLTVDHHSARPCTEEQSFYCSWYH